MVFVELKNLLLFFIVMEFFREVLLFRIIRMYRFFLERRVFFYFLIIVWFLVHKLEKIFVRLLINLGVLSNWQCCCFVSFEKLFSIINNNCFWAKLRLFLSTHCFFVYLLAKRTFTILFLTSFSKFLFLLFEFLFLSSNWEFRFF